MKSNYPLVFTGVYGGFDRLKGIGVAECVAGLERVVALLAADGISVSGDAVGRLERHVDLVRQMNPVVSVVSMGDLEAVWERHVFDSLSLAPVIARLGFGSGSLLDIGSGGGFPAVVLKVVLPELEVTVVERSEKKLGFLRKVVGALGLKGVTFRCGVFPAVIGSVRADIVTARAVERSEMVAKDVLAGLPAGSVFLLQNLAEVGPGYLDERVSDAWTEEGYRRGVLRILRRDPAENAVG